MKEVLQKFKTVSEAYNESERLFDDFLKTYKKKPTVELWLSMMGSGKNLVVSLVCVYTKENKTELEYYKSFYE